MLEFTRLTVDTENDKVIIRANIINNTLYDNVGITGVRICKADKLIDNQVPIEELDLIYNSDIQGLPRSIDLTIPQSILNVNLEKDMLFVAVTAGVSLGEDLPSGDTEIVGPLFNKHIIIQTALCLARQQKPCCPNTAYMNFILHYNTFKYAYMSSNYSDLIECWESFINDSNRYCDLNCCNCNG